MGKVVDKVIEFRRKYPGGIAWRPIKHAEVLEEYIDKDEELLYAFCAQKNENFSEIFHTFAVALTNKRLLLGHKRLIWGSFYYTITPDLYNDMEIYKGLIWGKVTIDTVKEVIVLSNIPKKALDEIETMISNYMMNAKKKIKDEKESK